MSYNKKAAAKDYYNRNRNKILKHAKAYRQRNKDKILQYRQQNEETLRKYNKEWRKHRDREQYNKQMREYRTLNQQRYAEYRKRNKTKRQEYHLKQKYGINREQHRQMFISQNGCCVICQKRFTDSKDVHVDHNHNTNEIRQLLCSDCNTMLGLSKEQIPVLLKAVEYLNKWNN